MSAPHYKDEYSEWESWQQQCRVCGRVKCPKPEAVGEWLEELVKRLHVLVTPDLAAQDWRFRVAHYEGLLTVFATTWSWALRGVCPDCLEDEAPKVAAYLDNPERVHFDAAVRWACLVPTHPSVGVVRARRGDGLVPVAAVWRGRGLAVHLGVDYTFTHSLRGEAWKVTHERSGVSLLGTLLGRDEAVALAELLGELADWEALDAAAIEADSALKARVRDVLDVLFVGEEDASGSPLPGRETGFRRTRSGSSGRGIPGPRTCASRTSPTRSACSAASRAT